MIISLLQITDSRNLSKFPSPSPSTNEPHDGLLGGFGYGKPLSQVKGSVDCHPDLQPWDGNAEGDVGSQSRSSCFVAPSGYHNTYPAGSEGSGDGRNVDDCVSALPRPGSELAAGRERVFEGHLPQAAGAGH